MSRNKQIRHVRLVHGGSAEAFASSGVAPPHKKRKRDGLVAPPRKKQVRANRSLVIQKKVASAKKKVEAKRK